MKYYFEIHAPEELVIFIKDDYVLIVNKEKNILKDTTSGWYKFLTKLEYDYKCISKKKAEKWAGFKFTNAFLVKHLLKS